jgi:2'-5' RNA ligase
MPDARVFYALPPPAAVREALGRLAVAAASRAQGRATRDDSIHLTLAFVGDVDAAAVARLVAIGARLRSAPFDLLLDTEGGFRRARVAWIAPSTTPPALRALQQALAGALADEGFALEARPFAAHVTLARHCRTVPATTSPSAAPVAWAVHHFALWQSSDVAGGARYHEVARWALRER